MDAGLDPSVRRMVLDAQLNEVTESQVYLELSRRVKDPHNSEVLRRISEEESIHAAFWAEQSGQEIEPSSWRIWKYVTIARLFGLTFAIKLMEKGEDRAQHSYREIAVYIPEATRMAEEENSHELELLNMIDEQRLRYVGSIVLGLNDALVELTGALAGYTFAFQDSRLIAMAGLITGIAGAMSMGASEYLSSKTEEGDKSPRKASAYTASAYVVTVFLLVMPFLLLDDLYLSLTITICLAVLVILVFTYYISVAKDLDFRRRFLEMAAISLGITGLTFIIGSVVRIAFGIEV